MSLVKLCTIFAVFIVTFENVRGHGKMLDPINRSSVWRLSTYDDAPRNDEDNENFCGGISVQHQENGGKCGPCGDNYSDAVPRKNENGGFYGKGHVVRKYQAGKTINVLVDLSTNHKGYFQFSICKLNHANDIETEECFDKHPLKLINREGKVTDKYHVGNLSGDVNIKVILPKSLKCKRCVLRWHYRCGNNWGFCNPKTGEGRLGCGDQETFRSCSDITIY